MEVNIISVIIIISISSISIKIARTLRHVGNVSAAPQPTIQYNVSTVLQYTMQYNSIQCNTMQYNTIPYNAIQCNTMQCNTIKCNVWAAALQIASIMNHAMGWVCHSSCATQVVPLNTAHHHIHHPQQHLRPSHPQQHPLPPSPLKRNHQRGFLLPQEEDK